jgi:hypothetical protein
MSILCTPVRDVIALALVWPVLWRQQTIEEKASRAFPFISFVFFRSFRTIPILICRKERMKTKRGYSSDLPGMREVVSHGYPLIRECAGRVPTGIAVQDGNYEHRNPKIAQPVTSNRSGELRTSYAHINASPRTEYG